MTHGSEGANKFDSGRMTGHVVQVNAQFMTRGRAQRAVGSILPLSRTAYVVGQHLEEKRPEAPMLQVIDWTGLALAAVVGIGGVSGIYFTLRNLAGDGRGSGLLDGNLLLLSFVLVGAAGALSWLLLTAHRVYRTVTGAQGHTMRALVPEHSLSEVEAELFAAGAQAVWVVANDAELSREFGDRPRLKPPHRM